MKNVPTLVSSQRQMILLYHQYRPPPSTHSTLFHNIIQSKIKPRAHNIAALVSSSIPRHITSAAPAHTRHHYITLSEKENYAQTEVKKSKFCAWAWPVTSIDHAMHLIQQRKDPGASHNCYAIKCGPGQYKSTDDGEPGGTAGRPILAAIESEDIDYVAVLVVRYFGGVKLGTGGLVRAYGGAAREVLSGAPRCSVVPRVKVFARVPFDALGVAYQVAESNGATRVKEEYGSGHGDGDHDDAVVVLVLEVESNKVENLLDGLKNASHGKIRGIEWVAGVGADG